MSDMSLSLSLITVSVINVLGQRHMTIITIVPCFIYDVVVFHMFLCLCLILCAHARILCFPSLNTSLPSIVQILHAAVIMIVIIVIGIIIVWVVIIVIVIVITSDSVRPITSNHDQWLFNDKSLSGNIEIHAASVLLSACLFACMRQNSNNQSLTGTRRPPKNSKHALHTSKEGHWQCCVFVISCLSWQSQQWQQTNNTNKQTIKNNNNNNNNKQQ